MIRSSCNRLTRRTKKEIKQRLKTNKQRILANRKSLFDPPSTPEDDARKTLQYWDAVEALKRDEEALSKYDEDDNEKKVIYVVVEKEPITNTDLLLSGCTITIVATLVIKCFLA